MLRIGCGSAQDWDYFQHLGVADVRPVGEELKSSNEAL